MKKIDSDKCAKNSPLTVAVEEAYAAYVVAAAYATADEATDDAYSAARAAEEAYMEAKAAYV